MHRYSRAADASTSLRPHHQRWISEPSSSTSAVATGVHTTKTSTQDKVAAATARQQAGASKTNGVYGRYQKNVSSSTLERDTKTTAAPKSSLSSTLQQLGDWARRSFRGHGGSGKTAGGRRPKSLNDYVMTEVSSGVVVERKSEKLSSAVASRDPSPVTTSSGYASGGDGIYSGLHDGDFDEGDGRRLKRKMQRGGSRGSRRYRRRASMQPGTDAVRPPSTPFEQAARRPSEVSAMMTDEIGLPVYENLLNEAVGLKCETKEDSTPVPQTQRHPGHTRHLHYVQQRVQSNQEVYTQLKPATAEGVLETGNISIDDYLLPTERSSVISSSNSSTLRRSGNGSNPVYVNGNLLMTSASRTCSRRHDDSVRRSRSLSSPRNRTLTGDPSTTFNFDEVQQRLSFTPSFVSQSPSPPDPADADADWDDRLSTLSLGCRRPHDSPHRRYTTQRHGLRQPRSKSARRRLVFGSQAVTSIDQRPEAVEECVRPIFKQTGPPPTISNVAAGSTAGRRSTGLFPRLEEKEESVYETINDVIERSRLPASRGSNKRPEMDSEHVYDNIDDFLVTSAPATTDIHQLPPPLPPPPLPARRPIAGNEMPLCRSEVVELDSHHVYTIADVLDSFEALAAHLPRAQQFIYDLQAAAYLDRRQQMTELGAEVDRGRRTAKDAEKRWTAAAAMNRGSSNRGTDEKSSTCCNGQAQRRLRHAAAMYSADESQPLIVEDYVCSPGNNLNSGQRRRVSNRTSIDAAITANPTHGDELYIPMKPRGKPPASTMVCCGGSGSATFDARPPNTAVPAPDAARRWKQPKSRSGKETSRMSATVSRSITELYRRGDEENRNNVGEGRRSSKPFQMPSSFIDAGSYMLPNSQITDDIARHHKALSRSLMDGISHQPSRPPTGNFADRKQNSRMTSSLFAGDMATGRRSTLLEMSSDDLAARRPHCSPRSASEDRQTGTGNSSTLRSSVAVGYGHQPNNKSSHRSRATDRTTVGLSRSLMAESTVPPRPTSSDQTTSFHELQPQSDRRRSSILQWTAASCSGREIFC